MTRVNLEFSIRPCGLELMHVMLHHVADGYDDHKH